MKIRIFWEDWTVTDNLYRNVDMSLIHSIEYEWTGTPWIVACGGREPIMEVEGYRYQYHWNVLTGEHKYYCFNTDLFLDNDQLPQALRA